jgi:hypothetical protein
MLLSEFVDSTGVGFPVDHHESSIRNVVPFLYVGEDFLVSPMNSQFPTLVARNKLIIHDKVTTCTWNHQALLVGVVGMSLEQCRQFVSLDVQLGGE